MSKFKPQYRRLLFIDRKLKERSHPNCSSLGREWEVSPKTIQRDLDYLRDELSAPIQYDPARKGYYYSEASFSLPAIQVSESDLFAVCIARTALRQFLHTPVYEKLAGVFERIQDSLPRKSSAHPAWLDDRIFCFPEPATRIDPEIWDTIARAIRGNRQLRIRHVPPGRKSAAVERVVDPYYLVGHKGEWYLSTHCHERQAIRTFAVSRIREASILPGTFAMPAAMDQEKMFGDQFGIIWKPEQHKVRIRFSAAVAPYVRERQWHPRQVIRERRDGGCVLEFSTNHINEVKDWILSWGTGARTLAPAILVERIKASLADTLAQYSTPTLPTKS